MMHRLHRPFLLAILIATALNAFAQTPPPVAPFPAAAWKASMPRIPSTGLQMGTLRVRFEKTTLDDVRRAAAVGAIAHRGDAGDSDYWLCYTNPRGGQAERIWILARGEIGGTEHYVTGISAELLANGSATSDCPALPQHLQALSLDKRLWLRASKRRATSRLGEASFQKGAWRSYDFRSKVPGPCEGGGFDLRATLLLHFDNGRVNLLHVGQATSC